VGVDLGGTNVRAALVRDDGTMGPVRKVATRSGEGPEAVLERIAALVERVAAGARVDRVGVGVPGPVDFATRRVVRPPNLPGWDVVPVAAILEERLRVPVAIENDANAVVLGEALHGAGRGHPVVLGLTLGTGIGGGLVIDGAVHHGATGTGAEIGHCPVRPGGRRCGCGARGCLEAYASATALVKRARRVMRPPPASAREIAAAARRGDDRALGLLEELARYLGEGIASAVTLLDPDVVVLAGGLAAASRFLMPVVRETVRERAFGGAKGARIVRHRLGDRAGILGAAAAAGRG
jgi:glucokinase